MRSLLPLFALLSLAGCKRSDPTLASAPSASAAEKVASVVPIASTQPRTPAPPVTRPPPIAPDPLRGLPPRLRLPDTCRHPRARVAAGPIKNGEGPAWIWTTQTWFAYEDQFVPVPAADGTLRPAVRFFQQPSSSQESIVELWATCTSAAVCNRLAALMRRALPNNQATPLCQAEPAGGEFLALDDATELAALAGPGTDQESAARRCVRWAVCRNRHDDAFSTREGLACLRKPQDFLAQRRCASGPTCYDVVDCAGGKHHAVPEFLPWGAIEEQFQARGEFLQRDKPLYSGGGGPLLAEDLHSIQLQEIMELGDKGGLPRSLWVTAPIRYRADRPDEGMGQKLYMEASATQLLLLLRPGQPPAKANLGMATGESDNTRHFGLMSLVGNTAPPLSFDYDGDGTPEVAVYESRFDHTRSPQVRLTLWTYQGGKVKPYPPSASLPAVGIRDVDEDGRPDLLLDTRDEELCDPPGPGLNCIPGAHTSLRPDAIAHSLPDGTFSTSDAVATKWSTPGKAIE